MEKNGNDKDYYELLEISREASDEVVKNAYRALAKKYHPDINNVDDEVVQEKIRQINIAYEVLSNPEKRKQYDEQLQETENEYVEKVEEQLEEEDIDETLSPKKKKMVIIFVIVIVFVFISLSTFLVVSILNNPVDLNKESSIQKQEENVERVNKDSKKDDNDSKFTEKVIESYDKDEVNDNNSSSYTDQVIKNEELEDDIKNVEQNKNTNNDTKKNNSNTTSDDGIITIY